MIPGVPDSSLSYLSAINSCSISFTKKTIPPPSLYGFDDPIIDFFANNIPDDPGPPINL